MKLKFHAMSFSLFKCIFHNNTFQTFTFENISFSHDRTQDGLIFKIKDLRTASMFPKNQTTCICVMCARYIWSILGSQWWCEWVLRFVLHPHLFVFLRSKWPGHFGDTLDYWKTLQKVLHSCFNSKERTNSVRQYGQSLSIGRQHSFQT